jgi:hypothetical protein
VQLSVVELTYAKVAQATPPMVKEVVGTKFVPVITIAVPPEIEPAVGETDEMVGGLYMVNPEASVLF